MRGMTYDRWKTEPHEGPDKVECQWCRETQHIEDMAEADNLTVCKDRCYAEVLADRVEYEREQREDR